MPLPEQALLQSHLAGLLASGQKNLAIAIYHHRNTKNEPLDFTDRHWLMDIYRDKSEWIVIPKASQIGVTEYLICRIFSEAHDNRAVLYVMPRQQDAMDISSTRIDGLAEVVPLYRSALTKANKTDNKSLKSLFGQTLKLVGSESATNFFSTPIDTVMVDEFDKCKQDNLGLIYDRTQAARPPKYIFVGNPILGGTGIEVEYHDTDRKVYLVKCQHCNHWQELDWWKNFIEETGVNQFRFRHNDEHAVDASAVCQQCSRPIDRLARGQWVKQNQDATKSGYRCTALFGYANRERAVIRELAEAYKKALARPHLLQIFYNNRLGIAYKASGNSFTEELFAACASDYKMPPVFKHPTIPVVGGVDVGGVLNFTCSALIYPDGNIDRPVRRKLHVAQCDTFDHLQGLIERFNVRTGCIDAQPEPHKIAEFLEKNPGWFSVGYGQERSLLTMNGEKIDHAIQQIRANRTMSLDATLAAYERGAVMLPFDWRDMDGGEWVKQMCASVRVTEWTPSGDRVFWREGDKADHYMHAENYERIASETFDNVLVTVS